MRRLALERDVFDKKRDKPLPQVFFRSGLRYFDQSYQKKSTLHLLRALDLSHLFQQWLLYRPKLMPIRAPRYGYV